MDAARLKRRMAVEAIRLGLLAVLFHAQNPSWHPANAGGTNIEAPFAELPNSRLVGLHLVFLTARSLSTRRSRSPAQIISLNWGSLGAYSTHDCPARIALHRLGPWRVHVS